MHISFSTAAAATAAFQKQIMLLEHFGLYWFVVCGVQKQYVLLFIYSFYYREYCFCLFTKKFYLI